MRFLVRVSLNQRTRYVSGFSTLRLRVGFNGQVEESKYLVLVCKPSPVGSHRHINRVCVNELEDVTTLASSELILYSASSLPGGAEYSSIYRYEWVILSSLM